MKKFRRCSNWTRILGLAAGFLIVPLTADELVKNGDFSSGSQNWSGDIDDDSSAVANANPLNPAPTALTLQLRSNRATRVYQVIESSKGRVQLTITYSLSAGSHFVGSGKVSEIATDIDEGKIGSTSYNPGTSTVTVYTNPNFEVYSSQFDAPIVILSNADSNLVSRFSIGSAAVVAPPIAPSSSPAPNANGAIPVVPPSDPGVAPSNPIADNPSPDINGSISVADDGRNGSPKTITTIASDGSITASLKLDIGTHYGYRLYFAFPPGQGTVTITKVSLTEVEN